jgi:hypothetical protein
MYADFFSSFYFVKFRVFFIVDLLVIVLVCIAFISWAIQAFLEIVCSLGRGSRYGRAPRTDAKSCPLPPDTRHAQQLLHLFDTCCNVSLPADTRLQSYSLLLDAQT